MNLIKTNKPSNVTVDFKTYDISSMDGEILNKLSNSLIEEINSRSIHYIIIDYKMLSERNNISGVDIVNHLRKIVKEFPMVILTQRSAECIDNTDMDPDKIYDKQHFLKCESDYSKNAVLKIFKNIERYSSHTDTLTQKIVQLKKERIDDSNNIEILKELIELESELDEYMPIEQSEINKVFDSNSLKEIVSLIEQANKLLGE